jgi:hypothetical protein
MRVAHRDHRRRTGPSSVSLRLHGEGRAALLA